MRALAAVAVTGAVLWTGSARAESDGPKNALSVGPLAFFADGASLQYERYLAPPRYSLAGALGLRSGASGDYSAMTPSAGIEARWWLPGRSAVGAWAGRAMIGPFVSLRLDLSWTVLSDDLQDRTVGSMVDLAETAWFGWRFSLLRKVEWTVQMGAGLRHEIDPDGRIASQTRWTPFAFGTTVGWMF